jgi:hypothetical protein
LKTVHSTANTSEYKSIYEISKSEWVALKNAFISKPRWTAKRVRDLGNINVSEAHSSRVALRYVDLHVQASDANLLWAGSIT